MKTGLSFVKFYLYTFLAFVLTAVILLFPADCLSFALKGLNLWFERMIPTLFPFMVLSGIIIRMDLTDSPFLCQNIKSRSGQAVSHKAGLRVRNAGGLSVRFPHGGTCDGPVI